MINRRRSLPPGQFGPSSQVDDISLIVLNAITAVNSLGGGPVRPQRWIEGGQWRMLKKRASQPVDGATTKMTQHFNYTRNRDGLVFQSPILTNYVEAQGLLPSTSAATDPTQA